MRNPIAQYGFEPITVAPWTDRAACTEVDPDMFYLPSMCRLAEVDLAKQVCAECPVFWECRDEVDRLRTTLGGTAVATEFGRARLRLSV